MIIRFLFLLCFTIGLVRAETQPEYAEWSIGKSIDVALRVSLPSSPMPRTIILPDGPITEVPSSWFEDQIEVRWIRNTVSLKLKDPIFTGTMSVYDSKGNLYQFNVRPARENEPVSDTLILRPAVETAGGAVGANGVSVNSPIDSDGAVTEMMVAMELGRPTGSVSGALQYRIVDGKVVPGYKLAEDDTKSWYLIKVWQGPRVRGYETLLIYKGPGVKVIAPQRIYFPGALAVRASSQGVYDSQTPEITVSQNQAIRLFFVAE